MLNDFVNSHDILCLTPIHMSHNKLTFKYIHTYITWIQTCVTNTTGCGVSHEYTKCMELTVQNTMNIL